MSYHFVFCHGWGFDHTFFDPLYLKLSAYEMTMWDLGYFGEKTMPAPPQNSKIIGIGHSFGLIQLINSGLPFHSLVSLQGFVDFFGQQPVMRLLRQRAWKKLYLAFQQSPEQVLEKFYSQCEAPKPARFPIIQKETLLNDLAILPTVVPLPTCPLLILGATGDKVVPPRLIEDNFLGLSEGYDGVDSKTRHPWLDFYHPDKKRSSHHYRQILLKSYQLLDTPGHNLGWAQADWVAKQIDSWLR